ncbi:hypothetical protein CC80DRAFT_510453 [Byssothecium circinans]|uniref:Uncharacterized protein n=1 Tax=Byssothecium circinans TaxID=147558 RepID=A0A6A5T962_9PLEO|nr:hypothetical protein CC80DRAFT_510453 [Byssothecium circinans]
MPFDSHGQLHAGSIGLFDDDDEWYRTQDRLDRNNARELHHIDRGHRKAEKRRARAENSSWWCRLFGRKKVKQAADQATNSTSEKKPIQVAAPVNLSHMNGSIEEVESEYGEEDEWPMYDEEDIVDVDSELYDILGMVLVKEKTPEQNNVVLRSQIRWKDCEKAGPPTNLLD